MVLAFLVVAFFAFMGVVKLVQTKSISKVGKVILGLGMLYLKYQRIKELEPMILWGGTVKDVSVGEYSLQKNSMKREAWTPNIIGAVSLLKALEWIEQYGWIEKMWAEEQNLVAFLWKQFQKREGKVRLLGTKKLENRVGVLSFTKLTGNTNFNQIWELFAKENICVRVGGHCAYPLHKFLHTSYQFLIY